MDRGSFEERCSITLIINLDTRIVSSHLVVSSFVDFVVVVVVVVGYYCRWMTRVFCRLMRMFSGRVLLLFYFIYL